MTGDFRPVSLDSSPTGARSFVNSLPFPNAVRGRCALCALPRQNALTKALQEHGRLFKTMAATPEQLRKEGRQLDERQR